jgi:hypothetical protein
VSRRRPKEPTNEWNNSPDKKLRQLSGGREPKETSDLSRPQKVDEDAEEPTPLVCSDIRGWSIDDFAKQFARKHLPDITTVDGQQITPCSVDALYFDGSSNWVFVEFKDDCVVLKENNWQPGNPECGESDPVVFQDTPKNYKAWLQRKLYDTYYMFTESGRCWDPFTTIAYIVVKGGGKNPAPSLRDSASNGERLRRLGKHLHNTIYPHYEIFRGMKFLYRQVHLVNEKVFKDKIIKDLSPNYDNV